jgi:NAD-dependent deacetylase
MDRIETALNACDLFVSIGTSGRVYPAAAFVMLVPPQCRKVEINVESTPIGSCFDQVIGGKATEEVPRFLEQLLRGGS